MTGSVAVERVARPRIVFVPFDRPADAAPLEPPAAEVVELAGDPLGPDWRERWDDVVVAWRQTTFYLFDPQGWR
jgi:hypothetical protein